MANEKMGLRFKGSRLGFYELPGSDPVVFVRIRRVDATTAEIEGIYDESLRKRRDSKNHVLWLEDEVLVGMIRELVSGWSDELKEFGEFKVSVPCSAAPT